MPQIERLNEITEVSEEELKPILYALGREYLTVAGYSKEKIGEIYSKIEDYEFWDTEYIDEEGGQWGMSTMDAFRCLVDVHRTAVLLGGIRATVKDIKAKSGNQPVAIDAGTGTGILSIGLIAAGCDKVIALEINEKTAKIAKDFLEKLGLSDKIDVITCDATSVDLSGVTADILVSENLSNGLFDEPQYHIIAHLTKYLKPDAKIIPYKADLFVSLGSSKWEVTKEKDRFTVAARKLRDLDGISQNVHYFELVSRLGENRPVIKANVDLPVDPSLTFNTLLISTDFQIKNEGEDPYVLLQNTAHFLGKTAALKLPREISAIDGKINVNLTYPTGMPRRKSLIRLEGDRIVLFPPPDWIK